METLPFHAVLRILYAVKISASFYKVQYEHKNEVWWAAYMCLFQIPWSMFLKNWQNWMTSD